MKECAWYVISYFALIHIAGLFLGMYLQGKITKYSMLKKQVPMLSKEQVMDITKLCIKLKKEGKDGK